MDKKEEAPYMSENDKLPEKPIYVIGKSFPHDSSGRPTKEGWNELSNTLSVFSDKRFETARYLMVKDGRIIRHIGVSSCSPSSTIIQPDDDFIFSLRNYAEKTDSKVIFIHNHPSGDIRPSENDITLTKKLENNFIDNEGVNRFCGHIILDHGNYGLYLPETGWKSLIDGKIQDIGNMSGVYVESTSLYGIKIKGENDLLLLAAKADQLDDGISWNRTNWIPAWFATPKGLVKNLEYINISEFNDVPLLKTKIRSLGRDSRSEFIYLTPANLEQNLICESFAQTTGMVRDVCLLKDDGYDFSKYSGGNIFEEVLKNEITIDDTDKYGKEIVDEKIDFEINSEQKNNMISKENNMEKNMEQGKLGDRQTWTWKDYDDLSGHLVSPDGNTYFSYDWTTKEYKTTPESSWDSFLDADPTRDTSLAAFKEYAERYIRNNIAKDKDIVFERNYIDTTLIESARKNEISYQTFQKKSKSKDVANTEDKSESTQEKLHEPEASESSQNISEPVIDKTKDNKMEILQEQLKRVMDKLDKVIQENNELRKENELLRENGKNIQNPQEAHEYNSSSEKSNYNKRSMEPNSFTREKAFIANAKVPPFGRLVDGKIEILKDCRFQERLEHEWDNTQNKVILIHPEKDGKNTKIEMSELDYYKIINNYEELEKTKNSVTQDSFEWIKAHENYNKNLLLDEHKYRINTTENFHHNFKVRCSINKPRNPEDAILEAKQIIDGMSKYEKSKFNKMRHEMGSEKFDRMLINEFTLNVGERDMDKATFKTEGVNEIYYDANKELTELPVGAKIGKTDFKVGDSITMAIRTKGWNGKVRKTPASDFKIVKVSKDFVPNRAIVYSEKSKASYLLPLDELERQIVRSQKQKTKEEKRQIAKDDKLYGYEGRS